MRGRCPHTVPPYAPPPCAPPPRPPLLPCLARAPAARFPRVSTQRHPGTIDASQRALTDDAARPSACARANAAKRAAAVWDSDADAATSRCRASRWAAVACTRGWAHGFIRAREFHLSNKNAANYDTCDTNQTQNRQETVRGRTRSLALDAAASALAASVTFFAAVASCRAAAASFLADAVSCRAAA